MPEMSIYTHRSAYTACTIFACVAAQNSRKIHRKKSGAEFSSFERAASKPLTCRPIEHFHGEVCNKERCSSAASKPLLPCNEAPFAVQLKPSYVAKEAWLHCKRGLLTLRDGVIPRKMPLPASVWHVQKLQNRISFCNRFLLRLSYICTSARAIRHQVFIRIQALYSGILYNFAESHSPLVSARGKKTFYIYDV